MKGKSCLFPNKLSGSINGTNETEIYSNSSKPFCANIYMSERVQIAYRYTLVIVQYFIPVVVISFVYIQVKAKSKR
jgi:leucokinin receptor